MEKISGKKTNWKERKTKKTNKTTSVDSNHFFFLIFGSRKGGKGPALRRNGHVSRDIIARDRSAINVKRDGHGDGHLRIGSLGGVEASLELSLRGAVVLKLISVDGNDGDVGLLATGTAAEAKDEHAEDHEDGKGCDEDHKDQQDDEDPAEVKRREARKIPAGVRVVGVRVIRAGRRGGAVGVRVRIRIRIAFGRAQALGQTSGTDAGDARLLDQVLGNNLALNGEGLEGGIKAHSGGSLHKDITRTAGRSLLLSAVVMMVLGVIMLGNSQSKEEKNNNKKECNLHFNRTKMTRQRLQD